LSESREAADNKAQVIIGDLRASKMATAADLVEQAVHETLTYYGFPDLHWQKYATTLSAAAIGNRSRRMIECAKDSDEVDGPRSRRTYGSNRPSHQHVKKTLACGGHPHMDTTYQPRDEMGVAAQPIELGHDDRRLVLTGDLQRRGERPQWRPGGPTALIK
jgi:hypothetical protein